jgi:hypothetical protein
VKVPVATAVLIHIFYPASEPVYDDEGELLLGSYYQFVDKDDKPVGDLIGPYLDNTEAEKAAKIAFKKKDI